MVNEGDSGGGGAALTWNEGELPDDVDPQMLRDLGWEAVFNQPVSIRRQLLDWLEAGDVTFAVGAEWVTMYLGPGREVEVARIHRSRVTRAGVSR